MAPPAPDALDALSPARHTRAAALARTPARRVAAALEAAPGPQTAQQLADALGLHHTGVRIQLVALERAGVVESRTDPPRGRGAPCAATSSRRRPESARPAGTASSSGC